MVNVCNSTYCFPQEATLSQDALVRFAGGEGVHFTTPILATDTFRYLDPSSPLFAELSPQFQGDALQVLSRCQDLRRIDRMLDRKIDGSFDGRQVEAFFFDADEKAIRRWTRQIRFCSALEASARNLYATSHPATDTGPDAGPPDAAPRTEISDAPPATRLPTYDPLSFLNWFDRHADLLFWGTVAVAGLALLSVGALVWFRGGPPVWRLSWLQKRRVAGLRVTGPIDQRLERVRYWDEVMLQVQVAVGRMEGEDARTVVRHITGAGITAGENRATVAMDKLGSVVFASLDQPVAPGVSLTTSLPVHLEENLNRVILNMGTFQRAITSKNYAPAKKLLEKHATTLRELGRYHDEDIEAVETHLALRALVVRFDPDKAEEIWQLPVLQRRRFAWIPAYQQICENLAPGLTNEARLRDELWPLIKANKTSPHNPQDVLSFLTSLILHAHRPMPG